MSDPDKTKTDPSQAPAEAPKAQESEAVDFKTTKEEMLKELEKAYEKRVSAGSDSLSEKAFAAYKEKMEKDKKAMGELFDTREKEMQEQVAEINQEKTADREALARQILGSATEEAKKQITRVEGVIDSSKGAKTYVDDAAVAKMLEDFNNIEKLATQDRETRDIAEKLINGGVPNDNDYRHIIDILNPYDIQKQAGGNKESCDATGAGIVVGFMRPDQRFRLVDLFMDSQKRTQAPQLIDSFIRTKILTGYQAEVLLNGDDKGFKGAVQRGIITPEQYQAEFRAKFDNGYYAAEIRKYEQMVEEIRKRAPSGNYADNIMNRVVGRPMLGGLAALWGFILTALNMAANWKNKGDWFKNPYIYAGVAGMVAGAEVATGTVKKGTPWFGAGVVGHGLDSLSENKEERLTALQKNARSQIADAIDPAKSPAEFIAYLDNGGYDTIREVRTKKLELPDKLIKLEDIIEVESRKNPQQTARLKHIAGLPKGIQDKVTIDVGKIAEAGAGILDIKDKDGFGKLLADIRGVQRPRETLPGAPAVAPSAVARNTPSSPAAAPSGPSVPAAGTAQKPPSSKA